MPAVNALAVGSGSSIAVVVQVAAIALVTAAAVALAAALSEALTTLYMNTANRQHARLSLCTLYCVEVCSV